MPAFDPESVYLEPTQTLLIDRATVSAPGHECPITILGGFVIAAAWFAVGLLFGMWFL